LTEMWSLRRELSLHLLIRNVLNGFVPADYDRLLELLNPRTIDLLGLHHRDHAAKMVCRILLAQPRLLRFAVRLPRGLGNKAARERVAPPPQIVPQESD